MKLAGKKRLSQDLGRGLGVRSRWNLPAKAPKSFCTTVGAWMGLFQQLRKSSAWASSLPASAYQEPIA
jgi:hypothetical protein